MVDEERVPHRAAFLNALHTSPLLEKISSRAHFGIWVSRKSFRCAEYAYVAKPTTFAPSTSNFMRGKILSFADFYNLLNIQGRQKHPLCKNIFSHGLGVPLTTMHEYIKELIVHHRKSINPSEEAMYILAHVSPTNPITFFCGKDFKGLLDELESMQSLTRRNRPAP